MTRAPPRTLLVGALVLAGLLILYVDWRLASVGGVERRSASEAVGAGRQAAVAGPRIVIYNRVPKTASTTFTNAIAYDLWRANGFNVVHLNVTKNRQTLSLPDQAALARNVSEWRERQPLFLHGHVAFVDFERFGYARPLYINMVREPLERLLSHYYFLRYGDNYRVGLKRARAGNNETFDACTARGGHDCDPRQMWLQVPYFCGQHAFCSDVGSRAALEQAKRTLVEKYLIVGTTERMRDLIALLDATLPEFFRGALAHFDGLDESKAHMRNTLKKVPPSPQTLYGVRATEVYKVEREFYDFAVEQFDAAFKRATNGTGRAEDIAKAIQQFHFEKIKPANPKDFSMLHA